MPIKNFSQYLVEEERSVFFTFGRMNPPTIGHGKVMDTLAAKSGKNDYKVYVSQSQNSKKDPLSYGDKVKHIRKMFPKHGRNIMIDKKVKTAFDAVVSLYDQGYKSVTMIVGADRVREFDVLLKKYNGVKARHGFYNFKNINIVSAGARDPDAEGVEGMSASKQRENAKKNDFVSFSQGVSKSMSNSDARKLFNDVRSGMGLKETTEFRNHVSLTPLSEEREAFVRGELFSVGDMVVIKESEEIGKVIQLGANFVIVESNGREYRKWLNSVEKLDEACWKGYKQVGMKKKGDKMVPDCVPEESGAGEEGTDKLVKKYKKDTPMQEKKRKVSEGLSIRGMMEEVSQKELNDLEKFADRLLNKFDVDIEFTRHFADRMNDKRNKPSITIAELQRLFKKMAMNKGKKIKKHGNREAILKDMQSDLNLPVVVNWKNGEFEVVNKTIMRKKAFKSPDPQIKYEAQDPDIKDREGTQPARYHKGLKKSTKAKRDAHFKKHGKKADDDSSAYKPAPGDKSAETKPSKYTKAFRDMYNEEHSMENVNESSFEDKSKKSGISVATLKKVYRRGVAAWKTGHRPGTTPEQWGHARVNAFIVKKKKGGLNHDKDLA